jgi:hypothetical protein
MRPDRLLAPLDLLLFGGTTRWAVQMHALRLPLAERRIIRALREISSAVVVHVVINRILDTNGVFVHTSEYIFGLVDGSSGLILQTNSLPSRRHAWPV